MLKKRCLIGALFLFFSLIKLLFAQNIPQPLGWVNDFANVIPEEYEEKLNNLIKEVEQKTSAEIVVATVESIAPYDEKEYARLLFDNWKPGKVGKDNGVLVLLVIKERLWRIETGYGIEGILPDGLCGEIGREYMVPYFKRGKYGEGLYIGVAAIAQVISKDIELDALKGKVSTKLKKSPPLLMIMILILFFFIWNLPWPFFIGFPFTLLFALSFFNISSVLGVAVIIGYLFSILVRYRYWSRLPSNERGSFFGSQSYGGRLSDFSSGGFGGGGFGGFGGGSGGGGGAGGRF